MQATIGRTGRTTGAEREGGRTDLVLPLTVQFDLDEITETLKRSGVEPAALTLGDGLMRKLDLHPELQGYWPGEAVRRVVEVFLAEHGGDTLTDLED